MWQTFAVYVCMRTVGTDFKTVYKFVSVLKFQYRMDKNVHMARFRKRSVSMRIYKVNQTNVKNNFVKVLLILGPWVSVGSPNIIVHYR